MSKWRSEPRGPGKAERMFVDVDGERFELLAYTYDAGGGCYRAVSKSSHVIAGDAILIRSP